MSSKLCSYDEAYDIYDAYDIGWCEKCDCDPNCPMKKEMIKNTKQSFHIEKVYRRDIRRRGCG